MCCKAIVLQRVCTDRVQKVVRYIGPFSTHKACEEWLQKRRFNQGLFFLDVWVKSSLLEGIICNWLDDSNLLTKPSTTSCWW